MDIWEASSVGKEGLPLVTNRLFYFNRLPLIFNSRRAVPNWRFGSLRVENDLGYDKEIS